MIKCAQFGAYYDIHDPLDQEDHSYKEILQSILRPIPEWQRRFVYAHNPINLRRNSAVAINP